MFLYIALLLIGTVNVAFAQPRSIGTAMHIDANDGYPENPYEGVPDTCDVGLLQSMEARAWMEAEREISQNQNLVFRPDSVMQYSCFNDRYSFDKSALFSGGDVRGSGTVNPNSYLKSTLSGLVGDPLDSYFYGNFSHENSYRNGDRNYFLGGRSSYINESNCIYMNKVWTESKCNDFDSVGDPEHNDGFAGFGRYRDLSSDFDPRNYPSGSCRGGDFNKDYWQDTDFVFRDAKGWLWLANPDLDDNDWYNHVKKTYNDALNVPARGKKAPLINGASAPQGSSAGASVNCSPSGTSGIALKPIGTGVMVQLVSVDGVAPKPYEEGVCIVPGCYFTPPSGGGKAKSGTCKAP